jgi:hypothetical protein
MRTSPKVLARVVIVTAVFGAGWIGGATTERNASAQIPGVGDAMKAAEDQGGVVGSAAKLGTTIGDMQSSVQNLQKGLDTLKSIQKALGG